MKKAIDPQILLARKAQLDRSMHAIEGILKGISLDRVINATEIAELRRWVDEHECVRERQPFKEVIAIIEEALKDGVLEKEEVEGILWLCNNIRTESMYYTEINADIQRLQGLLEGILLDGRVNIDELKGLTRWLNDRSCLRGTWPYDDVCVLVEDVIADGRVDADEHRRVMTAFQAYVGTTGREGRAASPAPVPLTLAELCTPCSCIEIKGNSFCFTGISHRMDRKSFIALITDRGGTYIDRIIRDLTYLVVGSESSPLWAFSCYGRKIEEAIKLKRSGAGPAIVQEERFFAVL